MAINTSNTITTASKVTKALKSLAIDNQAVVADVANRAKGTRGGLKGARHNGDTVRLLGDILASAGIARDSVDAMAIAMSIAVAHGQLAWVLCPSAEGELVDGPLPLASLKHKDLPEGAAVANIPPCGSFKGGLEVVASATIGKVAGLCLWRMRQGALVPCVVLAPVGKALTAINEAAKAANITPAMVAMVAHLASANAGGRALAALAALAKAAK